MLAALLLGFEFKNAVFAILISKLMLEKLATDLFEIIFIALNSRCITLSIRRYLNITPVIANVFNRGTNVGKSVNDLFPKGISA